MPQPRTYVSIGMPVYNGENYIVHALDSILAQTFEDFEVVICDNASTDATERICLDYAANDRRIRYHRNDTNLGAAVNYNRTFALSSGIYFKWAAHDDVCAPTFFERCVEILDADPSVVLSHPRTIIIDADGRPFLNYLVELNTGDVRPHVRFGEMVRREHWCYPVFGVFRTEVLAKTTLIAGYTDSDRVLLAETCLWGRVVQIPEVLFLRREHAQTSTRAIARDQDRMQWFDPTHTGREHYLWLKLRGYLDAIGHAPIGAQERVMCYGQLVRLLGEKTLLRFARFVNFKTERRHIAIPVDGVEWG